jgi:uncharacterized protein (DUF488 family)
MPIYTLGHSNHTAERFFELLAPFGVTHVIDVRSIPFSRHVPHFNRETFRKVTEEHGLTYEWWGESLGGMKADGSGRTLEGGESFTRAIESLSKRFGGHDGQVAVLACAEGDPRKCHRSTLIGPALRALPNDGVDVQHILPDGLVVAQSILEEKGEVPRRDRSGTMSLFD